MSEALQRITKHRPDNGRRIAFRKSNHLCIRCGNARDTKKLTCSKCLERDRSTGATKRLFEHRVSQGLCARCGNPSDKKICRFCYEKMAIKTIEHLDRLCHETFTTYGGYICKECGITDRDVLTIDHIEGKKKVGHTHSMTGTRLYHWLKKNGYPKGFQVLCMNCNFKKMIKQKKTQSKFRALMLLKIDPTAMEVN